MKSHVNVYMDLLSEAFSTNVALVIPFFAMNHTDVSLKASLRVHIITYLSIKGLFIFITNVLTR